MFTHLHVASGYSFKYGTHLPDAIVERAAQFEMKSLALTDRDGLAGAIRFVESCQKCNVSPILGVDLNYKVENSLSRITLIATSGGGWSSLIRLVTAINTFDSDKPVLTLDLLEKFSIYAKDVLALHGSNSAISQALIRRNHKKALALFSAGIELFADQAIECVSHLVAGDGPYSTTHAGRMLGFARDHDLPAVISNAARMLERSDGPLADILDCARNLTPLHESNVERKNGEGFLKSEKDMIAIADLISRAAGERNSRHLLRETAAWAERSILSPTLDIGLGAIHLPEHHVVGAKDEVDMAKQFRERCLSGLNWRYGTSSLLKKAEVRLEDELTTVRTLGYESYFLTVADITDTARASGIRVAARGSGAGSLICHVLRICGVESIAHGI